MNKTPAVIGSLAVFTVLGVALYTMTSSASYQNAANAIIKPQQPGNSLDTISRAPPTVDIPAWVPKQQPVVAQGGAPPGTTAPVQAAAPTKPKPVDPDMMPLAIEARKKAWAAHYAQLAEKDERQRTGLIDALKSSAAVEEANGSGKQQAQQDGQEPQQPGQQQQPGVMPPGMMPPGMGGGGSGVADNIQQHQRRFAFGQSEGRGQDGIGPDGNYLPHMVTTPISRYELKATDIITGRMVSGIITDSPGIIKAVVAQNVLDHATGMHILIPQGSTLVGTYDNAVAYGQNTVVTAWQRIIYPAPCSESLTLGMMPGSDSEGYGGFRDKTDNHYVQVFTNAILLSLFSAGTQLSQPQAQNNENIGVGQTVASAMGQQLGQLGQEFARRGLDIPPTNQIRNGYPFTIMLTKDIAFARPWKPCSAPGQSKMELISQ
jgi:type IV secretion system protein VirB10